MRRIAVVLIAVLFACLGLLDVADAAKQKKAKPVAPPKPIYEAPMRVVIVRNSNPACEPSCPQWIAAEGEITGATPALFRKVLKQMGKENLPVIIRSPGGSINAALEIGKMLRQRKMTAAVGATIFRGCSPADSKCKLPKENKGIYDGMITEDWAFCNSACPMVLAGATTRYASYRTSVGLHEPKTTWLSTRTNFREFYRMVNGKKKVISRKILSKKTFVSKTTYGLDKQLRKRLSNYYKTMGVDVAILEEMLKAKYKDIYILPDDKRAALKLRTTMEQAVFLGNPKLCGSGATSAVCVEDNARDPKVLALAQEKALGIAPGAEPMSFRLVELVTDNCTQNCPKIIVAEGRITGTTKNNFMSFLGSTKTDRAPVVLHSDGGDLSAALEMAQAIRSLGVATSVAKVKDNNRRVSPASLSVGVCRGNCAVLFAGGIARYIAENQQIELFHPDVMAGALPQGAVQLNNTLFRLDMGPELMPQLHRLKKNKGLLLTAKEALRHRLATQIQTAVFAAKEASPETESMNPVAVVADPSTCRPDCPVWIAASGRITLDTATKFSSLLARYGHMDPPIILSSTGGDGAAAMEIGRLIRDKRLTILLGETSISGCLKAGTCGSKSGAQEFATGSAKGTAHCEGACLLLFAGGHARSAYLNSTIAATHVDEMALGNDSTQAGEAIREYLKGLGFTDALAKILLSVEPGQKNHMYFGLYTETGLLNSIKDVRGIVSYQSCAVTPRPANCLTVSATQ